ncbi:hypothetical protein BVG16_07350 [Paenibacillus selenitireducens]|uniref:Calcineurin-like phosphoesterase domain-containing protein n=2 Tax=Paenibacillus selenitireducens TaxID=1324314 RepID=A0A1T2XLA6_9BACL|nr:hypothetical protein BVG16_07350 [Paenibacillus selenitireducens]
MSDIHIVAWDEESHVRFSRALDDYLSLEEPPDYIVLNGDLTDGHEEDYKALHELLHRRELLPPVFVTNGNHEFYSMWHNSKREMVKETFPNGGSTEQAMALFTTEMGLSCSYYDAWVDGYHLIFLSGEVYRDRMPDIGEDAWISEEQFMWLSRVLMPHREMGQEQPLFVFLHQPLPNTVAGSFCPTERGVVQHQRLKSLLEQYPQIIFFSGHTHVELSASSIYKEDIIGYMGTSSVRRPYCEDLYPIDGPASESVWVEVGLGKVVLQGRRHDTQVWMENVRFERKY